MKILHCITSLDTGGAEKTLVRLVNKSKYQHLILTIKNSHQLKSCLKKDIKIISISPISLNNLNKVFKTINKYNPDIVQGWMYHGDLLASFIGIIFFKPIFWNIRHGKMSFRHSSKLTFLLRYFLSIISYFLPLKIISCSNYGAFIHKKIGYCKDKIYVIHNGISIKSNKSKDYRNFHSQEKIRIASIGRDSPQKNRKYFIELIDILSKYKSVEAVIIGRGVPNSIELKKYQKEKDFPITLKDSISNIEKIFSEIDVLFVSSIYGEGCPNIIIEAMKSELLVICTNVGDSNYIVNEKRLIIPSANAYSAVQIILKVFNSTNLNSIIKSCKERADNLFDENLMVNKYESIWNSVHQRIS
tara:strand:- start:1372 stop:2445 length:1074 start_codon:yes stop_codon:yes gene_type:complete